MIHKTPHEWAGKTVVIRSGKFKGKEYRLEDWWDRLGQGSWMRCQGNPACLTYALRAAIEGLPLDEISGVMRRMRSSNYENLCIVATEVTKGSITFVDGREE